jgi:excisionase family DNA binding protein
MNAKNEKLLLTAKEAAEQLSVSPRKLWSMTFEDRSIAHVRCGRLVRYPLATLQDWINSRLNGGHSDES